MAEDMQRPALDHVLTAAIG